VVETQMREPFLDLFHRISQAI